MHVFALCFVVASGLAAASPVLAQSLDADAQNGRYTMTPAPDGFLRLDTRTGDVSRCTLSGDGVQCRAGADERGALNQEIDRLSRDNADLRRKLADATDQAPSARLRNALPNEAEVNGALDVMEKFMRRMMRVFREEPSGDRI
ncbi:MULTISPECIES: hypothetical protein [unclassified Beijerinckia]|uniref:hypothetical protein n=1 Tax=unclassified Beijerinckia TaxID=2638183 RepID=UPI00089D2E59|nr:MULTISPECIES: hypothetical protein [unclassified Beijerinckia]MDH7797346.1 hypothetical protein [Beijerinckia sp. GAS462]SEC81927.1 hypothetical protein SAMN05443249_3640 [Beijerinckia sp. 28-YEA-48]